MDCDGRDVNDQEYTTHYQTRFARQLYNYACAEQGRGI